MRIFWPVLTTKKAYLRGQGQNWVSVNVRVEVRYLAVMVRWG